jgi:long-chain acyl-CoA synthetase
VKTVTNLGDIFVANVSDKVALVDRLGWGAPREVTYARLDAFANACARALHARGLVPGDRVAIISGNRLGFLVAFFGILRAGMTAVPVNHKLPRETVAFIFGDSEVKFAFCDPERLALLPEGCAHTVFKADSPSDFEGFLDAGPFESVGVAPDAFATIIYTSGSTGRPKGVPCTHGAQLWILATRRKFPTSGGPQRALVAAPLFHLNGLGSSMGMLAAGAMVVLHPQFDPRRYLTDIEHYKVTWITAVPTMFSMALLEKDLLDPARYQAVRSLRVGSAPVTQALLDRIAEVFPNAALGNAYGVTEGGQILFGPHPEGRPMPPISCGCPAPGVELKLIDANGREAAQGALWIRSPAVMPGYLNNPGKSAEVLTTDGWFVTNDLFSRDGEGFYYFLGRADDMFVCGGENIFPGEVEAMLERHPAIAQACVVPVADEIKWQKPVAFIVLRTGATLGEEQVKAYALANAPPYHHPRMVVFVDTLPWAGTNKIDRKALTARAEQLWRDAQGATQQKEQR